MEVYTTACFVFMIYCTQLFGLKQCIAVPVPTLLNYNSYQNTWDVKQQSRNSETYHDKFVFFNKEPWPIIETRSAKFRKEQQDSGKIYFPDEMTTRHHASNSHELTGNPAPSSTSTRRRPLPVVEKSEDYEPETVDNKPYSGDGSQNSTTQLPDTSADHDASRLNPLLARSKAKLTIGDEERIDEAIREFYTWLRSRGNPPQRRTKVPPEQSLHFIENDSVSHNKDPSVSDQSLLSPLNNQQCPPGHIRVSTGECKKPVDV